MACEFSINSDNSAVYIHTSVCVGQVGTLEALQPGGENSHELHNVSDGAKTPSYESKHHQANPVCGCCCCHGTRTKCTQEQSERTSSSSRSVCLIRPHFILLLLLQFIAKASETYIHLRCGATLWQLDVQHFLQSERVKSVYPWVWKFFHSRIKKNKNFFQNKSCCWFFWKKLFNASPENKINFTSITLREKWIHL